MADVIEMTIMADTNDGDYVTEVNEISQEDLDRVKPLIEAIKAKGSHHNWENLEHGDPVDQYPEFDEEVVELFNDYCPSGEYGIHTIEEISIQINPQRERLL